MMLTIIAVLGEYSHSRSFPRLIDCLKGHALSFVKDAQALVSYGKYGELPNLL